MKKPSKKKTKKDGTPSKQGEGGGNTPTFKNEEEFYSALREYLNWCSLNTKMPNVAGFCSNNRFGRNAYYDYCKKYPNTKKMFEASVEDTWVNRLSLPGATGAIFYLKNMFRELYKDRIETDITSKGEKIEGIKYIVPHNQNGDNTTPNP